MKTLKRCTFMFIAMIALLGFSSCESDESTGFDIAGMDGITWEGNLGFKADNGEPIYNDITFYAGSYSDHGSGRDYMYYQSDNAPYAEAPFDWSIVDGVLYLDYPDNYLDFEILYPRVYTDRFTGEVRGNGFPFTLHYVGGRAVKK